jgi:hypothetical protein
VIAGVLILYYNFSEFTQYIVSDISPLLLWGSSFRNVLHLGYGDVDGDGVVLGVPVIEGAVIPWSVVLSFPNWSWKLDWYGWCWHWWSRWLRLDHGRHRHLAAASPKAVS